MAGNPNPERNHATPSRRYLLITPCRDEADHLPETIRTVAVQTVLPTKWIIVDDGSTDRTPEILAQASREHPFLEVLRRERHSGRRVGPGVIEAFYAGLAAVDLEEFDYVCKFDADLEIPSRYFEHLMEEMEREPRLGNVSGKPYLRLPSGRLVSERMGDENAVGMTKFYRVACFRDIGGFVPEVSWDGLDGHACRRKGWIARSIDEPQLRFVHRRQMGSSHKSLWTGRLRWGFGKYFMGSAWYYVTAVALYRAIERPYLIGGLGILAGYFRAMMSGAPRYGDLQFRRYLRRYERRSLLRGKNRVTEEYHARIRRGAPCA